MLGDYVDEPSAKYTRPNFFQNTYSPASTGGYLTASPFLASDALDVGIKVAVRKEWNQMSRGGAAGTNAVQGALVGIIGPSSGQVTEIDDKRPWNGRCRHPTYHQYAAPLILRHLAPKLLKCHSPYERHIPFALGLARHWVDSAI